MDDKVQAVLDIYHQRIKEERERPWPADPATRHTEFDRRLLAVGPETGQFINIVAKSLSAPTIVEIGTSFGYSGIWLAEAARASGGRLVTMELDAGKSAYARDMAEKAGLAGHVDFLVGDAVELIEAFPGRIDFVLLDLWKDLYLPCLDRFYPKLNPGAVIVADNMIRPGGEDVGRYGAAVRARPGMRSLLLPVGSGLEVSCYEPV